jgi:orotate phosphoribosyltransferase
LSTFKERLTELGGYWEYSGGRYLALLASGKISDVFCNTGVLTTNPKECNKAARELAAILEPKVRAAQGSGPKASATTNITWPISVIGPGMGGITLAYAIASELSECPELGEVNAMFTEPVVEMSGVKGQKFRFELPENNLVVLIEDVITTGGSLQKTYQAVQPRRVLLHAACLVDRRAEEGPVTLGDESKFEVGIVSLMRIKPTTWDTLEDAKKAHPNVVEAIKPKANWAKIVAG